MSRTVVVPALTALVVVTWAHVYTSCSSGPSSSGDSSTSDPSVDAETVVAVFEALNKEMQSNLTKLVQMVQQIQASGQQIPDAQIQMWVVQEYEKGLTNVQSKVFSDHGVDEDELEEAVKFYLSQPEAYPGVSKVIQMFKVRIGRGQKDGWSEGSERSELHDAVLFNALTPSTRRFPPRPALPFAHPQNLYKSIGGKPPEKDVAMPKDVDLDKFCSILTTYMSSMTDCMGSIVSEYRASTGKDGTFSEEDLGVIRQKFSSTADDVTNDVLKKEYGIDQDQFTKLMEAYQTSQKVQVLVQELGHKQNVYFKSLGLVG